MGMPMSAKDREKTVSELTNKGAMLTVTLLAINSEDVDIAPDEQSILHENKTILADYVTAAAALLVLDAQNRMETLTKALATLTGKVAKLEREKSDG